MAPDSNLFDDLHFYRETVVDIDAAVVGTGRTQWQVLEESEATHERAQEMMCRKRFDILPITSGRDVREYYSTTTWGDYSSIQRVSIQRQDIISRQTHIRDVIKGLATDKRCFYFLSYEHYIVGLVSIADLNCRQVKVYLFSLLSELEIRLGEFITPLVPEDDLFAHTIADGKEKHTAVKDRFDADRKRGLDAPLIEYLYLSDMVNIIAKFKLFKQLGFESGKQFKKVGNLLNDLRNEVAHPTRSLVSDITSVSKLWRDIDAIEELIFRLR